MRMVSIPKTLLTEDGPTGATGRLSCTLRLAFCHLQREEDVQTTKEPHSNAHTR